MMPKQNKKKSAGKLYCVATPIGNFQDLSPRAREILQTVQFVAAEDTRVFQQLCSQTQLSTSAKFVSYFDAKESEKAPGLVEQLLEGNSIALVSDAGTPNISDPGYRLLTLAFENNIEVVAVPGCSSVAAALSICPLPGMHFCFLGFPPSQKNARLKLFKGLNFLGRIVFFESPHRLREHLEDAQECWGPAQKLFIARELTKKHEEVSVRTLSEWIEHFAEISPKGEFVLIYDGESNISRNAQATNEGLSLAEGLSPVENLDQWLQNQINLGRNPREILKDAQSRFNINRKEIYNKIMQLKENKK